MAERRKDNHSAVLPYRLTDLPPYRLLLRQPVVGDPRRHQDDQVTPALAVFAEAEELADDRETRQQRDAAPVLLDFGDREAADDRGLAVVHQQLVVGLLLREDEA